MIKLILYILENDSTLKTLLGATAKDSRIYASTGDDFKTQIIYRNMPLQHSDFISQSRLNLSIIDTRDALIDDIEKRIKELLLIPENVVLQDSKVFIASVDYQDGNQEELYTEGGPKLLKRDINLKIVWRYK